jgi:hypothetical protein
MRLFISRLISIARLKEKPVSPGVCMFIQFGLHSAAGPVYNMPLMTTFSAQTTCNSAREMQLNACFLRAFTFYMHAFVSPAPLDFAESLSAAATHLALGRL